MIFSKWYGLSAQDIFVIRPFLRRLLRRRRRHIAKVRARKVLSIFKAALQFERARGLIRERNRLSIDSLLPSASLGPWYHMYQNADDPSLIKVISLPRSSFEELLQEFSKHYSVKSGTKKGGRPPRVKDKHAILSILLHYYTGTMEYKTLCELFAVGETTLSRIINKAESALAETLRNLPEAQVRWPTLEEQELFASKVNELEPLLRGRWGFADGKNLRVQEPTNEELQNAMYNGWLHAVFVTGVLCLAVDGTISWGRHNFVGSWNDGDISRGLQDKLRRDDINLPGYGITTDTAFPVAGDLLGRIMTPLKEGDEDRIPADIRPYALQLSSAVTRIRQAAEWGMDAVGKVYRILERKLPFNPHQRGQRLKNLFMLYNYRVRTTGISQIRSVFFG